MKARYALVAGLILMLVGAVAFAYGENEYNPYKQANLNIALSLTFGSSGDLTFGPKAPLVGSIGPYTSGHVTYYPAR